MQLRFDALRDLAPAVVNETAVPVLVPWALEATSVAVYVVPGSAP
jgi:hypothetical protein